MSLDNLVGAINSYAGVVENSPQGLDTTVPGSDFVQNFGALGDYASKIDQSAQRSYVEDGFVNAVRPRSSEILMQEPNITVLIKKKMFSSLAENFKPELMDAKEKLFYRASKKLFQNKCMAISAYEQLTKIDRLVGNDGALNDFLFPLAFSAMDILDNSGVSLFDNKTKAIFQTLRKVKVFSEPNYRTTWLTDKELPALSDLGDGTGVFEITNVASIDTTVSTVFGGGNFNFTIEDPYKMMLITDADIDRAIRESAGGFLNNPFFRVSQSQLEATIDQLREKLNETRTARGVGAIRFFINEEALLFKKVRAVLEEQGLDIKFNYDGGLGGIGSDIEIDPAFIGGVGISFENDEAELFKQTLKNIYIYIGLKQSTKTNNIVFNQETNYVRRKMRLHFSKKPIIQSMDVVHIYKSSKSYVDSKISLKIKENLGGAIANAVNDSIAGLENSIETFATAFGGAKYGESYTSAEKNAIAGSDFPMWLWVMMRNDFTKQAAGTHTCAGVVNNAQHSYNSGKYTLSVSGADNCSYFTFSQINIQPSVEVYNAGMYDPLTPYELEFDASTGFLRGETPNLLQENALLLNSGVLKFKNGRFKGYPANEQIYNSFEIEKIESSGNRGGVRRKFEDPDGFVYRWKEGIQSWTLLGEPHPTTTLPSDSSPNLFKDPFAGQDVMNVLSLLITGLPYNFNTFMKASISSGAFSRDDLLNENSARSFFRGLLSEISKSNATWGNFVPFKKLLINQSAYSFLLSGEFDLTQNNFQLTEKLKERAKRFDQLIKVAPTFANNPQYLNVDANGNLVNSQEAAQAIFTGFVVDKDDRGGPNNSDVSSINILTQDILKLDFEIEKLKQQFLNKVKDSNLTDAKNGSIQIFGDDISYNPAETGQDGQTPEEVARFQDEFRKKVNYLAQRRLWKVKANEDNNLFIVDDSYDKNFDIQAFEKTLEDSLQLFKSNYLKPFDRIQAVATILGLEVFADSQGHIQARPPQYNRMPSSVFYRMVETKDSTGIQLFPPYLESLFINQVQGLTDRIEIIEDEIRIRAAALGYIDDQSAATILSGFVPGAGSTAFGFVTDETTGKFGSKDLKVTIEQANPDIAGEQKDNRLKSLGENLKKVKEFIGKSNSKVNFDIVKRSIVVAGQQFPSVSIMTSADKINYLGKRLEAKTNQPGPTPSQLLSNTETTQNKRSQVDVLNITEQIGQFLSQRQSALKLLTNALKNLSEGVELNDSKEPGRTALLPFINKKKSLPEILAHMIEDEDEDDYGYGSGKRFIIKDHQIISFSIKDNAPDYTTVEVTGLFGEGLAPPGDFDTGGGNPISTAWATDWDMTRMYGFRTGQTVPAPFLSDPDAQCAPYAVFLLNKARGDIFRGDLTIAGNEFIQAGEVYYIESYDLLVYAESVRHSFSYGGSFTTQITWRFGHNPGEYVPTILDIVGKGLYTNKHQGDLVRHNRHGNSNGDVSVTTLVYDVTNASGLTPLQALVSGSYGEQNRKALKNLLLTASGALNNTSTASAKVEIRTYYSSDEENGFSADSDLGRVAKAVKDWIINPSQANITTKGDLLPDTSADEINNMNINPDNLPNPLLVDLADTSSSKTVSSGALNKARELLASSYSSINQENSVYNLLLNSILAQRIIDVWITFDPPKVVTEVTKNQSDAKSQAAQKNFEKSLQALGDKVAQLNIDRVFEKRN